jgi:regulator of sigma E protease
MLFLKILLGLAGLGIIVFVHETGHFLAARLVGIHVDAFSIGWGKAILRKKIGGVEYRLGMFPIGGYCKMRGESEFAEAWENNQKEITAEKGSFFAVSPFRRIVVALAGPLFNLLFAMVVFSIIWGAGFEIATLENKIVLVSDISPAGHYPADDAGLRTGDRIIRVDGKPVTNYNEVQQAVAVRAEKRTALVVERDGKELPLSVTPELDKSTGMGRIGVYFWMEPVIEEISAGSPAETAGLKKGDRIQSVNGQELPYTVALYKIFDKMEISANQKLTLAFERNGEELEAECLLPDDMSALGIVWQPLRYHTPRYSPVQAVVKGSTEMFETFVVSVQSLSLLFRGIDLSKAVSGPVRITYMAGDIAAESFSEGVGTGLRSFFNFLSLISIALAVMNLLPLPVLDGGLVLIFIVEALRRRPLHPRFIAAFQTVGVVLICSLMVVAVFGDILFLAGR